MSYNSIADMAENWRLMRRVTASAFQEEKVDWPTPPEQWVNERRWDIVDRTDWIAAWDSAVAAENPDPGGDPGVITDQMILSAIQPMSNTGDPTPDFPFPVPED